MLDVARWHIVKLVDTPTYLKASERTATVLTVGIALLGIYQLALAAMMAFAPHYFFKNIGPFGIRNDHYIRDVSTYNAAIAAGLLVAVRRRSWRVPLLAVVTLQFALHSVNHLLDIDAAHPSWNGYFDFFSLAIGTALIAWLWRLSARAGDDFARVEQSGVQPESQAESSSAIGASR
jgi:hypothetical protein